MKIQIKKYKFISVLLLLLMLFNVLPYSALAVESSSEKVVSKPLVIMMEYQDYKFSDIDTKEEWRLRGIPGKNYTKEFVQELLFGEGYYTGEDEKQFMSVRKYYDEITAGNYCFDGKVIGPYTAEHEAAYYGSDRNGDGSDQDEAMLLVREAVQAAAEDPNIDLSEFDVENRTGDGEFGIPDGVIDTVIVIHPGIGEEWGGGSLKEAAIWPFRCGFTWFDENNFEMEKVVDHKGKEWKFDDFVIIAQDSASDMLCHEYGHVMGLPDLYGFSGSYPPVEWWSIMGGSYTGKDIAGTMPNSYGAYCREFLQKSFEDRKVQDPKWANYQRRTLNEINAKGMDIELHQAHERLDDTIDLVRIDLPKKETIITTPPSGEYAYFSGKGNDLRNSMKTTIDLTDYEKAKLQFKAWYKIDPYFDFATVRINEVGSEEWETVEGNITTTEVDDWIKENEPEERWKERNPGYGITDDSKGWVDAEFDLSKYAGKKIDLTFYFWTDSNTPEEGIYIDDIIISGVEKDEEEIKLDISEEQTNPGESENSIESKQECEDVQDVKQDAENKSQESSEKTWVTVFEDDADGEPKFDLSGGFTQSTGKIESDHYYLLEWRNSEEGKVDEGLKYVYYKWPNVSYDPGLLVWYVNEMWTTSYGRPDQQTADHPGECFAGVVDADQNPIVWEMKDGSSSGIDARGDFMMHDAAFSLREEEELRVEWSNGAISKDNYRFMVPEFNDEKDYTNPSKPEAGLILPKYGLKVLVTEENKDRSKAKVHIMKGDIENNSADYSDGLNVKNIKIEGNTIIVEAENKGLRDNLGEKAYMGYIKKDDKGNTIEAKEQLVLVDGIYKCSTDFLEKFEKGKYKVNFIILEDAEGNARAIYNSKVHSGYGMDLSSGDIDNNNITPALPEDKPIKIKEIKALDKKGIEKTEFEKGNTVLINTTIDVIEKEKVNDAIIIIEVKDKNGVPYALRYVPFKEGITEYSLGFSTYETEKGENTVNIYVWDNLEDRNPLSQSQKFIFIVK